MSKSSKPSPKSNPGASNPSSAVPVAPAAKGGLSGLDWLLRPIPDAWPSKHAYDTNSTVSLSQNTEAATRDMHWTGKDDPIADRADFAQFLEAVRGFEMPAEVHPPKGHSIRNEAHASMLFSIFMLDPVIRLMNCMLEKAKKDNFRFDVTPESTYSARDERGRLDYKVWLCKDHDEVERSLKTALSQVKVSATSLKGSSIKEEPEESSHQQGLPTPATSSSTTANKVPTTGSTSASKKPGIKMGELPKTAKRHPRFSARDGQSAGTAFFVEMKTPSAMRVEHCVEALRKAPRNSRPAHNAARNVLCQITSYFKANKYRYAFVSTFCGTFSVEFTDDSDSDESDPQDFGFSLCETFNPRSDPRVMMAYRAWHLARSVKAL